MAVYVSELEIKNFRSCISTRLELTRFTPLVGRNNCGKSNCLTALQWLMRKFKLAAEDFNDPMQPVEVVGHLIGIEERDLAALEGRHRAKIETYIRDGKLRIRRLQSLPGADQVLTVFDSDANAWVLNPTGIDNAISALFPEPIRIGAMEDAEEDASKSKTSTTIGKLLASMLESIQQRHQDDLAPHLHAIIEKISSDGSSRCEELGSIDASINEKIRDLFPGVGVKLDFPVPTFNDLIKAGTVRVYEEAGEGRPFGSYGHGAQRAIQMAMIRHLADLRRESAVDGGVTLLLVDEPELFMHPFAIEQVREAFRDLSGVGYQVIFSTHSAQMMLANDAADVLLVAKSVSHGTQVRPRLRNVVVRMVAAPSHQLLHLFALTNSSQILFSERVILTEGKTELRLLPSIFRKVRGRTLGQEALAIVSLSGVASTKKSMEILRALGLPARAIVDLDFAFQHGVAHGFLEESDPDIAACKNVLARLAGEGKVKLNAETGLPTKKGGAVSAADAYRLMVAEPDTEQYLSRLITKLREQKVWLWCKGAIEDHLGLAEKTEKAWVNFQLQLDLNDIDAVCPDADGVRALVQWLTEPEHPGVSDASIAEVVDTELEKIAQKTEAA